MIGYHNGRYERFNVIFMSKSGGSECMLLLHDGGIFVLLLKNTSLGNYEIYNTNKNKRLVDILGHGVHDERFRLFI